MITQDRSWIFTCVSNSHSQVASSSHFGGTWLLWHEFWMNSGPASLLTVPKRFKYGHLKFSWLLLTLSSLEEGNRTVNCTAGNCGSAVQWPCFTSDNSLWVCACVCVTAWTNIAQNGLGFYNHKSKQHYSSPEWTHQVLHPSNSYTECLSSFVLLLSFCFMF